MSGLECEFVLSLSPPPSPFLSLFSSLLSLSLFCDLNLAKD